MAANDPTRTHLPCPDAVPPGESDRTLTRPPDEQTHVAGQSLAGLDVPGYQVVRELGRGAMGVVYEARQTGLNRTVALKMLLGGPYASTSARARFLIEAEAVAALEHPHVVRVFAFGEHAGHPFLAMEHLPGGTLAERVTDHGPLPPRDAAGVVAKLTAAVAHAHARGVIHRDIKPGNVLLTTDGEPRLTDFGLAKVGGSDLTATGVVLGTPAYMSPEQAAGRVKDIAAPSDVYALGAVLYDVLTGRPPFEGDSVADTLRQVLTREPDRLLEQNPAIPRDLETVCLKCLRKEPGERYPTALALADDLNRFLLGEPVSARPAGPVERAVKWIRRNKGLAAAVATVVLTLVVGSVVSVVFGVQSAHHAEHARQEAIRADREADEAKRLETQVQASLSESRNLTARLQASLDQRRAALSSLAYGPLCAAAARVANAADRREAHGLIQDYQGSLELLAEGGDPEVKKVADDFAAALAEWKAGPPLPILRQRSLRLARTCRDSWLNKVTQEFPELAQQMRARLYTRVCSVARGLLARGDAVRIQRSREEFLELYWGELAIVESVEVERKMVALGNVLDGWPAGQAAPAGLTPAVAELHEACGRPFAAEK